MSFIKKYHVIPILLALVLLLAACSSAGEATPTTAAEPAESAQPTAMPGEMAIDPTASAESGEETDVTDTPVAVAPAQVDECLVCHLDKQRLIDTTAPVVEVETENEGEG